MQSRATRIREPSTLLAMRDDAARDFDLIAEDYAFFEAHATEAEAHGRVYVEAFGRRVAPEGPVRMLDFGCGTGTFTERVLRGVGWSPERLHLMLVDPAEAARRQAVVRLQGFSDHATVDAPRLPGGLDASFEVILSNHALYYVPDLAGTLARLVAALARPGCLATAIASRENVLIRLWTIGFGSIGRPVPFNTSEDVEAALSTLEVAYQKQRVDYELAFPDTHDGRMHILRFLLADQLPDMPLDPLMAELDRYRHDDRIAIRTHSDLYTLRR